MEPISVIATGYATDKLIQLAERMVHTHVIERWTRKRAIEFYRYFCISLFAEEPDEGKCQDLLNQLLEDDTKSEILFEAYRLVCLAKSKTIGPRIIAVVVAAIIQRNGMANGDEEILLAAAETLSDDELLSFSVAVKEFGEPNEKEEFEEILEARQYYSSDQKIKISQGALVEKYGNWAEKMKALGLISETVMENIFEHALFGSGREIVWSAHFHKPSKRLMELIDRLSFGINN